MDFQDEIKNWYEKKLKEFIEKDEEEESEKTIKLISSFANQYALYCNRIGKKTKEDIINELL